MSTDQNSFRISIAPMMDVTDRHFRYWMRLFSPIVWLYTEMITPNAILFGDRDRLLGFSAVEHPIVIQLGGSDPVQLANAAAIAEEYGYDEINLNVGCPSDRVQAGAFGACLMKTPKLVAECVSSMQSRVKIPVTVKTRIGVDDVDSLEALCTFMNIVSDAGCQRFIVHARKAWLQGLSPKQNRDIPPLDYARVLEIKRLFPKLQIELNGGIKTMADLSACHGLDGVMLGRIAQHNAVLTGQMARYFIPDQESMPELRAILLNYLSYAHDQLQEGVPLTCLIKPLFGLYQSVPGAKQWRRLLSTTYTHTTSMARWEFLRESIEGFNG